MDKVGETGIALGKWSSDLSLVEYQSANQTKPREHAFGPARCAPSGNNIAFILQFLLFSEMNQSFFVFYAMEIRKKKIY